MSGINIIRQEGGLGRQQPGEDYFSSILIQSATLPSGFGASDRIKKVNTLAEAVALGINDTHSDETLAAGGEVTITAAGAAGDVWTVTMTPTESSLITLGTYTEGATDTDALIAAGLAAAINALTISHGFTASAALAVLSIVAAPKWGAALNAVAGLVATSSGAGTDTTVQFTGGVGSEIAPMYYQISEFFKMAEIVNGLAQGVLYIGIYNIVTWDGSEISLIQDFAEGKVRQMAVYLQDTFASSMVTVSQTVCETLRTAGKPLSVLLTADFSATTLSALADMRALDSENVSVIIGEDKSGEGKRLTGVLGRSVSCIGITTGSVAVAAVMENIGWRGKFDVTHGTEYEELQFVTGEAFSVQSTTTLQGLTNSGYIYLTKEIGINGSYHNDAPTATLVTSDYAYLENNRTIDKATRLVRTNLTPKINSPLYVNADDGKLSDSTIEDFKNDAFKALEQMARDLEISTNPDGNLPANSVVIDPDQNVLSTSEIILTVTIVPVGVARTITVNIGFAVSIA